MGRDHRPYRYIGKECNLTAEEIVKKIADAGIVGLGGACFPTQVKLCPPPAFKAECVIINAVECEPYLTADHQLMLEHAEEIMVGVSILMKAVKVNKAFIGIENNKPDAIQLMTKVAAGYAGIEVVPLKVQYPQGGAKKAVDRRCYQSPGCCRCIAYLHGCRCTECRYCICRISGCSEE